MDFRLKNSEQLRTVKATKASGTVIEAGDLVALSSGLIIKATAGSTRVAYAPNGAPAGVTQVDVTVGNDFTLVCDSDAAFAVTDKGATHDIVVSGGVQKLDIGETSTNVLRVGIGEDAGTASSASNVEVKIEAPLF